MTYEEFLKKVEIRQRDQPKLPRGACIEDELWTSMRELWMEITRVIGVRCLSNDEWAPFFLEVARIKWPK